MTTKTGALPNADLVVGATYTGGTSGQLKDEPISRLLGVGNMGGIRQRGPTEACELVALFSTLTHPRWPDVIDPRSGVVTYHGDNETTRALLAAKGNVLLRSVFERGFESEKDR